MFTPQEGHSLETVSINVPHWGHLRKSGWSQETQKRLSLLFTSEHDGQTVDLTEGRVCQIHKEAIGKLRVKMARWTTG